MSIPGWGRILPEEAMAVIAVGLVLARAASTQGDSGLLSYQAALPIDETDPASDVEGAEVSCPNRGDVIRFLGRKPFACLELQRAGWAPKDRRSDLVRRRTFDVDPGTPLHIEHIG
jgi:hypothetical protein